MSVCGNCNELPKVRIAAGIYETAAAIGIDPVDLATAISYETAGSFDPLKRGQRTQWGVHRGLIQFGEQQARQHGVDWDNPIDSQLGPNGAVASYLRSTGVRPGHGLLQIYSAINAGSVGRYSATDENNGGAPGTVREKVSHMVRDGHKANAERFLRFADQCSCLDRESTNPTIVMGDQDMSPCLRKAGLFAIRVYHNPPENVAEALREDYNALDQHWDILWDRGISSTGASPENKQQFGAETGAASEGFSGATMNDPAIVANDSGFYCFLASPKEKHDAQGNPTCPPVLAFRGSEPQADELRGLVVSLRFKTETVLRKRNAAGVLGSGKVIARGQIAWPFHIGAGWEDAVTAADETFDWSDFLKGIGDRLDPVGAAGRGLGDLLGSVWEKTDFDILPDDDAKPDALAETLETLGIKNDQNVLYSNGQNREPPTTWLMRRMEDMLEGEFWSRYEAFVTLHYNEMGDWAANVNQALGLKGKQYASTIEAVDAAIPEAQARGNRLNITGHSLGGGLSQAAALYCKSRYPDIKLGCQIFNAAGLHEETARDYADSTRGNGLSIPIFSKQVAGELLTTAQTPGGFPLIWDIFRWQGVEIPNAIGVPDLRQGISPGPFPVGAASDKQFDFREPLPAYRAAVGKDVQDGGLLPFVFPLSTQSRYAFETESVPLTPYGSSRNTGSAPRQNSTRSGPLVERNELDEMADIAAGTNTEIPHITHMDRLRTDEAGRVRFPHVEAISGIANNANDFDEFASNTATYLMNALDEDIEERGFIEKISPLADLVRIYRGAKQTFDEFSEEIGRIGQLGGLAGAYHPMDIGGSTFLRPPDEDKP